MVQLVILKVNHTTCVHLESIAMHGHRFIHSHGRTLSHNSFSASKYMGISNLTPSSFLVNSNGYHRSIFLAVSLFCLCRTQTRLLHKMPLSLLTVYSSGSVWKTPRVPQGYTFVTTEVRGL